MTTATVRETLQLPGGAVARKTKVRVRLVADDDVTVTAGGYVTAANETVMGTRWVVPDTAGLWSLAGVHPNSGDSADVIVSPAGTRYEIVVFFADGSVSAPRYIAVPDSAGPHEVQDILSVAPSALTALTAAAIPVTAISGAAGDDVQEVLESLASAGGDQVDGVDKSLSRTAPLVDSVPVVSGTLYLAYVTATVDQVNHLQFVVGDTGAAATPSLVKFALFSVNADTGALTRVAVASSAPVLGDPDTAQALQVATVTPTVGARYAIGLLVVTTEATPTMVGIVSELPASIVASDPALSHAVTGLADMPSSVAPELLEATTTVLYASMYYADIN